MSFFKIALILEPSNFPCQLVILSPIDFFLAALDCGRILFLSDSFLLRGLRIYLVLLNKSRQTCLVELDDVVCRLNQMHHARLWILHFESLVGGFQAIFDSDIAHVILGH